MGPNLFDSPRLTLERAKHHVRDLDKVVADFRREAPWSLLAVDFGYGASENGS